MRDVLKARLVANLIRLLLPSMDKRLPSEYNKDGIFLQREMQKYFMNKKPTKWINSDEIHVHLEITANMPRGKRKLRPFVSFEEISEALSQLCSS